MLASLLLRLGALGPLIYYGLIVGLGFMTPGYNHVTQYISELGASGAPMAKVFNYGIMAAGGAMIVGAIGLLLGLRKLGSGVVMPLLAAVAVALFGVSFVIAGLHPMPDPMHNAYNLGLAGVAAPLFGFLAMGDRSQVSGAKMLTVICFLASAVLMAIMFNVGGLNLVHKTDLGLWQRGLAVAMTLWMLPTFLAIPSALAARERKRAGGH